VKEKLDTYLAGLPVNPPIASEDSYYENFEAELRNFWTNGSFYCILAGMGWLPRRPLPWLRYRPDSRAKAAEVFEQIRTRASELSRTLPTNHEFLRQLHRR
jgi:tryptophan halogenase